MVKYDLLPDNGWTPDWDALESMDLSGVKLMWTNYPGMPTGAKASRELYRRIVDFARRHGILVINDNPYSFILNEEPLSILEVDGAMDCCMEMNSLSKAHNMAGWRIGMIAGAKDHISVILKVKSQMDSGMFRPLQEAAIEALRQGPEWFRELNAEYRRRKDVVWRIFDLLGAKYERDTAGLFVWGRVNEPSGVVSDRILYGCGVFITPGFIFGRGGENYIRASLCQNVETLEKAEAAIKAFLNETHQ